jgi:hypothetical protein
VKKPDEAVLPSSGGETLDRAGVKDTGYIDKKGTPSGEGARFNYLPPGSNIENQECADIRELPLKEYSGGGSYKGDGWS